MTFYCESVHQPKKFDLFRQTIFPHERMGSGLETNPPTVTDDKFASLPFTQLRMKVFSPEIGNFPEIDNKNPPFI